MFKKTLVCLDGSSLSEGIIPYILQSCLESGNEVVLCHVTGRNITIPPPESIHAFTVSRNAKPVKAPVSDIGEATTLEPEAGLQLKSIEKNRYTVKRYMEDIAKPFRSKGIKFKIVILEGDTGPAILNYANSNNISLIALTTHGSGGLKGGTLGRVAQVILKKAETPVLIIKPGKKESN
jgi:nucleotide-binding universal stress UspA family protein